jgi:lambda family phage portal protein
MDQPDDISRLQALADAAVKRWYDAAGNSGSLNSWQPQSVLPESEINKNESIERRARDLYRNSPLARTIVDSHEQQIIHGGVNLRIQGATSQAKKIQTFITDTLESAELDSNLGSCFNDLLCEIIRETSVAGNCLILRVFDKEAPLGFRLKLLEWGYVDSQLDRVDGKTRIVRGVELNANDTPVAYWLKSSLDTKSRKKSIRYSRDTIAHVYVPPRVGALGGVSWLTPAMAYIRQLEDILFSAQQRQATAQAFTAFVTLPSGYRESNSDVVSDPSANDSKSKAAKTSDDRGFAKTTKASEKLKRSVTNDEYAKGFAEIRPNTFYILRPGEEIKLAEPPMPIDLGSIIRPIAMFISKSVGLSYETILGDFANSSYSASRMAESQPRLWTNSKRSMIKTRLLDKIWTWIRDGLEIKGYQTESMTHSWQFPLMTSAHPKEELEIKMLEIANHVRSRREYIRGTNRDPDMVFAEISEEQNQLEALGIDGSGTSKDIAKTANAAPAKAARSIEPRSTELQ